MSITPHEPRPTISGSLRIYAVPAQPLDDISAGELYMVVERFFDALRLEMLPGTLKGPAAITRGDDGKIDARAEVVDLELGALRVLDGMLRNFAMLTAPLGTMMAWCGPVGTTPNLLDTDAPLPVHRGALPCFATITIAGAGAAPPLAVEVVFGRALTDEEKDRFAWEIEVWTALVQGGYPEPGERPGTSAIGPLTVRFDDPQTLRLHAEGFLASDACFEPLKALVTSWSASVPVESLEVE